MSSCRQCLRSLVCFPSCRRWWARDVSCWNNLAAVKSITSILNINKANLCCMEPWGVFYKDGSVISPRLSGWFWTSEVQIWLFCKKIWSINVSFFENRVSYWYFQNKTISLECISSAGSRYLPGLWAHEQIDQPREMKLQKEKWRAEVPVSSLGAF